jgi:hypothetical protein
MQYDDDGVTWRGCPFVPYPDLTPSQQEQARRRFSPAGREDEWRRIENWAFAVRKDGELAKCPYIEPYYGRVHVND